MIFWLLNLSSMLISILFALKLTSREIDDLNFIFIYVAVSISDNYIYVIKLIKNVSSNDILLLIGLNYVFYNTTVRIL